MWLEIIVYIWQTHKLPVFKLSSNKEEVEGKQPLHYISSRQYTCIQRMKIIVGHNKEED
jgi:hypothetical protein